jgi:hypothetical protein
MPKHTFQKKNSGFLKKSVDFFKQILHNTTTRVFCCNRNDGRAEADEDETCHWKACRVLLWGEEGGGGGIQMP